MILKSFWRKKTTKIYLIMLTSLFLTINMLFIAKEYVAILKERQYLKISLVENISKKDNIEILEKDKNIHNIKRTMKLRLINGLKGDIFINHEFFTYRGKDTKYKLNDNEVIIRLSSLDYINKYPLIEEYKNKQLTFSWNDETVTLTVKDIISDNKRTELIISDNLFSQYVNKSNEYNYTFSFTSTEKYYEFLNNRDRPEIGEVTMWDIETAIEYEERMMLEACSKFLNISIYSIDIIFLVIIFIVNKNIISDFSKNIDLEHKLGFKNKKIKLNTLKCLLTLHIASFMIILILNTLVISIVNLIIKANINVFDIKIYYIFMVVILIIDLLLCIIRKKCERR